VSEIWRPIPGYEETHEVSNAGQVRSYLNRGGRWGQRRAKEPRLLSVYKHKTGYMNVTILGETLKVHRLVLLAFVGPAKPGQECCHANGIGTDNRLENLRWDSRAANYRDRIKHGAQLETAGEKNGRSKLTSRQVKEIKLDDRKTFLIAKDYGVSWQAIDDIKRSRKWKHV